MFYIHPNFCSSSARKILKFSKYSKLVASRISIVMQKSWSTLYLKPLSLFMLVHNRFFFYCSCGRPFQKKATIAIAGCYLFYPAIQREVRFFFSFFIWFVHFVIVQLLGHSMINKVVKLCVVPNQSLFASLVVRFCVL